MASGLRLALLTLNLTENDFNKMNRDNLKKYIENFFKQENIQKDFEKYTIAAKLLLENKPRVEEENIYDDENIQEENKLVRNNHSSSIFNNHSSMFNNHLSMFNNHFSTMTPSFAWMNEIENFHKNIGSVNIQNNSNSFSQSYSKTYVNNNGNGYIKEDSIEKNNNELPKVKSFYKKIKNGKYIE